MRRLHRNDISPLFAYEWAGINAIQNIAREVVRFDVVDESLDLWTGRRKYGAEHRLDLVPTLLDGMNVAFGRTALEARP